MNDKQNPHSYKAVRAELGRRLRAEAVGFVQLLAGPRQVGKTTLLQEITAEWGPRALYVSADGPEAMLPGWWDNLWQRAERLARERPSVLLFDEIHYLPNWQRLLKTKTDALKQSKLQLRVVATGSSALSVGCGVNETMAGRFEKLRLLHWPATELSRCFALDASQAARIVVAQGGYPGAVALLREPARWSVYLRDSIIEPAIGRDLLAVQPVRRPALLRQLFAIATGHPAEIFSLQKIGGSLQSAGAIDTIADYLRLLEETCLVAGIPKYSGRIARQRAAPPKLIVLNNALLSAQRSDGPPVEGADPERWGRWLENACLAFAWNAGQQVFYWREEPLEVDGIIQGSWGQWAIEIKGGAYGTLDLQGVLEFCRRNKGFRPLMICRKGSENIARSANVDAVSWEEFLLQGPPG